MGGRIALVREPSLGAGGGIARGLERLGWDVRPLPRDLEAAVGTAADLWVVDLGRNVPEALSLLRTLLGLRAVVPLLVIVEPNRAGMYECELEDLIDVWPAPLRLIFQPFSAVELSIQSRSVTRGIARLPAKPEAYEVGALRVDTGQMRVWYGSVPLVLRHPQFIVLAALARARGNVVTKAALLGELHEDPDSFEEGAIRSHVSRLRAALIATGAQRECIRTVHGQGYAIESALLEHREETTRRLRRIGNVPAT